MDYEQMRQMMDDGLKWEWVDVKLERHGDYIDEGILRTSVFGGWLCKHVQGGILKTGWFVPDRNHDWKITADEASWREKIDKLGFQDMAAFFNNAGYGHLVFRNENLELYFAKRLDGFLTEIEFSPRISDTLMDMAPTHFRDADSFRKMKEFVNKVLKAEKK